MNGRVCKQVGVDKEEVIGSRLPDQGARITRVDAHSEHPQVEQYPRPIQRCEVVREGRYAQNLSRARSGIENVSRNVPVGASDTSCLHKRGVEGDYR